MMSFYDELHFPWQPEALRLQQQLHSRQKRLGAQHDHSLLLDQEASGYPESHIFHIYSDC